MTTTIFKNRLEPGILDRSALEQAVLVEEGWMDEFGEQARLRVLVANEPRLYREAIAATLRELRSDIEVLVVDAEALDREVQQGAPGLVFCTRASLVVKHKALVWVELYPEDEPLMVVNIGEQRLTMVDDAGLSNLLWIVDQAKLRSSSALED